MSQPLLELKNVSKVFQIGGGLGLTSRRTIKAADSISFAIPSDKATITALNIPVIKFEIVITLGALLFPPRTHMFLKHIRMYITRNHVIDPSSGRRFDPKKGVITARAF